VVADAYAAITDADPALVARIAEVLKLRAADPQQQAMRQTYLGDRVDGRPPSVLESWILEQGHSVLHQEGSERLTHALHGCASYGNSRPHTRLLIQRLEEFRRGRHAVPHSRHHRPSICSNPTTRRPSAFHQSGVGGGT
jgi:hypothetical protein